MFQPTLFVHQQSLCSRLILQSLLSSATILPGTSGVEERHVDAEGKRSFAFDHITLVSIWTSSIALTDDRLCQTISHMNCQRRRRPSGKYLIVN